MRLSFSSTLWILPLTFTRAKASGGSFDSSLFLALVTLSIEMAVWVAVMPLMLRIFSTVLKALMGSLVFSLITRSNRPVTGVTDATLVVFLSWLMIRASSPLAFAKTKLVDSDLDIVLLRALRGMDHICQRLNQIASSTVTLCVQNLSRDTHAQSEST